MTKRLMIFALLACTIVLRLAAQESHLKIHFDFTGATSTGVPDKGEAGLTGTLKNDAKIMKMGRYHVLSLGEGNDWFDLSAAAGEVVKDLGDCTISVYYRVASDASLSGAGCFLWTFSQAEVNTADSAPYFSYRLNAQRLALSTGGWGGENALQIGGESAKGRWMHLLYRQTGAKGELFVDGVLKQTNTAMPLPSAAFTAAPQYNWLGRPAFAGDNYLTRTLVTDFRVYDEAVTDEAVAALAVETADLNHEYMYGEPGDFTELEQLMLQARELIAAAGTDYAPNAVAELKDVVRLTTPVTVAKTVSQPIVEEYVTRLNAALKRAKSSRGFTMSAVSTFPSEGHGFVHPCALHTQADFDRIKKLLAEGDPTITAAFNALKAGEYVQSGIATWPTWEIVRGGKTGQNYMNVARGAAMAYQNALVWKINSDRSHADAAVRILMAWARGNRYVGGDTNKSLASGIYGYELANAAELVRDYEGWSREDFDEFKRYILRTWYPGTLDFLRRRHETWRNTQNPSAHGERPGHYWSNWGLCNTLALMSYGILLDDVHMYNQGISFFKYDHVGTFPGREATHNRTEAVQNWGLNEFLGNLVPVTHDDACGPYGEIGQMQESGRDAGHEQMAAGLGVDIAQVAYNQGDDLFAYMDHRLAAGVEFVAAHNFGGQAGNLPFTEYQYADCRTARWNSWNQTGYGSKGEMRPYWDRVIGHYEGVKGVPMRYSEMAAKAVRGDKGYDMGGHSYGENSGGYDHLGFSTLTCYRPTMADPATAPIELTGRIIFNGETYDQTDLGGLKYDYNGGATHALANDGAEIVLEPILPDGVTDNGHWQWNTGETTRSITVRADHSYVYRVCYTSDAGTPSFRNFSIAVAGDCASDLLSPEITVDGTIYKDSVRNVLYGSPVSSSTQATTAARPTMTTVGTTV